MSFLEIPSDSKNFGFLVEREHDRKSLSFRHLETNCGQTDEVRSVRNMHKITKGSQNQNS